MVSPEQTLSSLLFFYIFWLGASLISAYFLEIHPCAEELFLTHKDGFKMVSESKLLFGFGVFVCVCVLNLGMSQVGLNAQVS